MRVGYARVSRKDQKLEPQRDEYATSGVEWEPIRRGLLEQPSGLGGTATVHTVGHNFEVVDKIIGKADYF